MSAKQQRWSDSDLSAFKLCPRKFSHKGAKMDLEMRLEKLFELLSEQGREIGILQARRTIAEFIMELASFEHYSTKELALVVLQMEIPSASEPQK